MSTTRFSDFNLIPALNDALATIGYEQPSPIQARSIPVLLEGKDILGMAQTGTGKTAAFALPVLNNINLRSNKPQALVLTPTRELAIQVSEAFQRYATHMKGFHVLPVYGGQGMGNQLKQLSRGVHVIVGTPGRVMDHLRRKSMDLSELKCLVLDEADEMLRMGFIDDVEWILNHTPAERQTALFSATMPPEIKKVTRNYLKDPTHIMIESATSTVENIEQRYLTVRNEHKLEALTRILEIEEMNAAIIFVRTKTATVELAEKLEARGYASAGLNGDINQLLRERTIEQLKNGKIDIVVATDVAARGIDVKRVSHVINYDIPYDTEAYVHRIGRTGRAGASGKAILFVAPREKRMLSAIERATRQPIEPIQLPTQAQVAKHRLNQFKQTIVEVCEQEDLSQFDGLIKELTQEHELSLEQVSKALSHLLNKASPILLDEQDSRLDHVMKRDSEDGPKRDGKDRKRGDKEGRSRRSNTADLDLDLANYRIEVGKAHNVSPKEIVGAIANEAGLDSQYIGKIKIFEDFSTVQLPSDMPAEVFQHLKKVRVVQQRLDIKLDKGPGGNPKATKERSNKSRKKPANKPVNASAASPKKKSKRKGNETVHTG